MRSSKIVSFTSVTAENLISNEYSEKIMSLKKVDLQILLILLGASFNDV